MGLPQSFRSLCAASLVAQPTRIQDASLKLFQLKLAARNIAQWAASVTQLGTSKLLGNVQQSIATLFVQIVFVHLQALPSIDLQRTVLEICSFLLRHKNFNGQSPFSVAEVDGQITKLESCLMASSHLAFKSLVRVLVLPCFKAIVACGQCNNDEQVWG